MAPSIMTIVAFSCSIFALGLGAVILLGEGGYGFDLRRRDRRRDTNRAGGRRLNDWA